MLHFILTFIYFYYSIARSMGYTIRNKVTQAGAGMQGLCPQASVFPLPTVCRAELAYQE